MYAKLVEKACNAKEDATMKDETENMEKMKTIREEKWGQKEYVKTGNLYSVRNTWEVQAYMLKVAGNYSHQQRYAATGWRCQGCDLQVREDQDHLIRCRGYADLL